MSTDFHLNYLLEHAAFEVLTEVLLIVHEKSDTNKEYSVDTLSVLCSYDAPMQSLPSLRQRQIKNLHVQIVVLQIIRTTAIHTSVQLSPSFPKKSGFMTCTTFIVKVR